MALFTLILLPSPPIELPLQTLPLVRFYADLLRAEPLGLGLTLAGIALGLLLLRLLDGRPAPLLFRLAAVVTAALALAGLPGLVPAHWALATATGGVLVLLLDEAVHLLARTFQAVAAASAALVADARRLLARKAPKPNAVGKAG